LRAHTHTWAAESLAPKDESGLRGPTLLPSLVDTANVIVQNHVDSSYPDVLPEYRPIVPPDFAQLNPEMRRL